MNKTKLVKELNDNCEHNNTRFFEKCIWEEENFDDKYMPNRSYCSLMFKNERKDDYDRVLCDSCYSVLNKYKNITELRLNALDELIEKILDRLDRIESVIQHK